jgi:hypothetical protein
MTESPDAGDTRALEQQAAALPAHALDATDLAARRRPTGLGFRAIMRIAVSNRQR